MERKPTRPPSNVSIVVVSRRGDMRLTAEELAATAGISLERLTRLVDLGLVESAVPEGDVFTAAAAERLKRMLRLHGDLGVSLFGAAIIVDLLERLDGLEMELERLRGGR